MMIENPTDPLPQDIIDKLNLNFISYPGSELSKILKIFGFKEKNKCGCKSKANYMDQMEFQQPGWCEKNINVIVGWMEEEAKNRHLPFIRIVAKALVKLAIYRAKKNATFK